VLGVRDGALVVAVAAPPVDGEANAELIRTVAEHFGLPRSRVSLQSGGGSRTKRIRIAGVTPDAVLAKLPPTDY
jgi:uncharacterized protein (TIGR00251 family)